MMAMGGIFTLLGELRDELGFSESGLGLMVAMGFFTAFCAQIGLARFSDRGHTAVMLRFGLASVTIGMALMAVATELWQFIGLRMVETYANAGWGSNGKIRASMDVLW